jgi:hypothetical protein
VSEQPVVVAILHLSPAPALSDWSVKLEAAVERDSVLDQVLVDISRPQVSEEMRQVTAFEVSASERKTSCPKSDLRRDMR